MSHSASSARAWSPRMRGDCSAGFTNEDPRMRSPFPGMDPYLEDQGRWPDFHARAITYCCDLLSQSLPGNYVAQMGEDVRVVSWQEGPYRSMQPDVSIMRSSGFHREEPGGVATMATLEPIAVPY